MPMAVVTTLAAAPLSSLSAISTALSDLSLSSSNSRPSSSFVVRMGGGPRTFPGGVSKWQWKRMQAKKSKQLLKARLLRERQIYDMRRRTELRAAVAELERPWEPVTARELAPALMSVSADEQVKTLADRFHRPGGFDMWNDRDGPRVFRDMDGVPSQRFFPRNAVHSVKPYTLSVAGDDEGFKSLRPPRRTEGVRANALTLRNSSVDDSDGISKPVSKLRPTITGGGRGKQWNAGARAGTSGREDSRPEMSSTTARQGRGSLQPTSSHRSSLQSEIGNREEGRDNQRPERGRRTARHGRSSFGPAPPHRSSLQPTS